MDLSLQEWLEGDGNYLAPELLSSEEPTFAADIYSAGATIFECCTGVAKRPDCPRLNAAYTEAITAFHT